MNIKTIALATILATGIPVAVQAQETNDIQNYQVSCNANSECSNFKVNYETEGDQVAQTRRTRTRRTRSSSSDSKYYVGGTVGVLFPGDPGNTGIGGSAKFGYNFSEQYAAEAEGFGYFGGTDTEGFVNADGEEPDINYNILGAFINGVGKYSFNQDDEKSIYGYAGGGLGLSRVAFTGDDVADDASETDFAIQGKVGVGYPVSNKLDIVGQFRYVTIFVDGDTGDAFGIDAGINYNL